MSESDQEYHGQNVYNGGKYLSSHALIDYINCPAYFDAKVKGTVAQKDSDTFKAGRAAHCLILEGQDEYKNRYVTGGPINEKTGKPYGTSTDKYKNWAEEQKANGAEVLTPAVDRDCILMQMGVMSNTDAIEKIRCGNAEVIIRSRYCGEDCQIKVDFLSDEAIIDLKTCRDLQWFKKDFFDYKYDHQLSFYQKVHEQFSGHTLPVYVIAVQNTAPHIAAVFEVQQSVLDEAQRKNEKAIRSLRESRRMNYWTTGYEGILSIDGGRK